MPRYTLEVLPLVYTLGAAGTVALLAALAERWRLRRAALSA
jgi:hypothetical protein